MARPLWILTLLGVVTFISFVFQTQLYDGFSNLKYRYRTIASRTDPPNAADPRAIKEQLFIELMPFVKQMTIFERELLGNSNGTSNLTTKIHRTLNAGSDAYFQQVERANGSRTVFFTITRSTFLDILSPRLYAVHCNRCWPCSRQLRQNFHGVTCLETQTFEYNDRRQNVGIYGRGHYNVQLGHYFGQNATGDSPKETTHVNVGYVHVVKDAYITSNGDVKAGHDYFSIVQCRSQLPRHSRINLKVRVYERVFSIAQYWGFGYFHFTIENLPRLALPLAFLHQNMDVRVHVASRNSFTRALLAEVGISADRLITGDVRAKIAYIPGGTKCGQASLIPINILSILMRSTLVKQPARDTIVLIKRSTKRWFNKHSAILTMLKSVAQGYRLRLVVFADKPTPPLSMAKDMFNRAVLIVGPHGAGLSNIIFSQPGTCVVEGQCFDGKDHVNRCYQHLAQVLGHIYMGVVPLHGHCKQTEAADLEPHINSCLQWMNIPDSRGPSNSHLNKTAQ